MLHGRDLLRGVHLGVGVDLIFNPVLPEVPAQAVNTAFPAAVAAVRTGSAWMASNWSIGVRGRFHAGGTGLLPWTGNGERETGSGNSIVSRFLLPVSGSSLNR